MGIFDRFRKPTLRELCRREYGDEYVRYYDKLCDGGTIGGFVETVIFLRMLDELKEKYKGQWR